MASQPMPRWLRILAWRLKYNSKKIFDPAIGRIAVFLLRALRRADRARVADWAGAFMRRVGPWLPEHRVGRANLAAGFPEKSSAEIEKILRGSWDNLGRVAAEFAFLDRIHVRHPADPAAADAVYDEV